MNGWSTVFELSYPDQATRLLYFAAEMARQADEVGQKLREAAIDDPVAAVALEHYSEVEMTVRRFLSCGQGPMEHTLNDLKPTGMQALKLAAALLSKAPAEPSFDSSSIDDLLEQTRSLIDDVAAAEDLDLKTRNMLVDRLRDIEQALITLRITGGKGVARATDSLLGLLRRQSKATRRIAESTVASALGGLIVSLVVSLGGHTSELQLPAGTDVLTIVTAEADQPLQGSCEHGAQIVIEGETVSDALISQDQTTPR